VTTDEDRRGGKEMGSLEKETAHSRQKVSHFSKSEVVMLMAINNSVYKFNRPTYLRRAEGCTRRHSSPPRFPS
jgi:hypothetical protein